MHEYYKMLVAQLLYCTYVSNSLSAGVVVAILYNYQTNALNLMSLFVIFTNQKCKGSKGQKIQRE